MQELSTQRVTGAPAPARPSISWASAQRPRLLRREAGVLDHGFLYRAGPALPAGRGVAPAQVRAEKVEVSKIRWYENPADLMTKVLTREEIRERLGYVNIFVREVEEGRSICAIEVGWVEVR